jgi:glucose-1-phosphate cytidylyltransferase
MAEIGGRPILWHIMKHFSTFGFREFIICVGYRGDMIKDYFLNYRALSGDFTVDLSSGHVDFYDEHDEAHWRVTVTDTGAGTTTGGRVRSANRYIDDREFVVTYGDGVADVDLDQLMAHHRERGLLATVTTVRPMSRFGVLDEDESGTITHFREKPQVEDRVSAGFFVFEPEVIDFIDPEQPLETLPLNRLVDRGQLSAYHHDGFWQPMDTYRERRILEELWQKGEAPWKTW